MTSKEFQEQSADNSSARHPQSRSIPRWKWQRHLPVSWTIHDPARSHRIGRVCIDAFIVLVFISLCVVSFSLSQWSVQAASSPLAYITDGLLRDFSGQGQSVHVFSLFLIAVGYLTLIVLFNRFWVATALVWTISDLAAIATRIKIIARNEPVLPVDLTTFRSNTGEVLSMMPSDGPRLITAGVISLLAGVVCCIGAHMVLGPGRPFMRLKSKKIRIPLQIVLTTLPALFLASFTYSLGTTGSWAADLAARYGDQPLLFNAQTDAQQNGYLLTFLRNVRTEAIEKPSDYSSSEMEKIATRYATQAKTINASRSHAITDDTVIFVLSESFSDPTRVPGVQLSRDPMPYIRSLKTQTASGLMLSSGYGGGTANLEFQALTGMSTANFSPTLRSPYQQLVPKWKHPVSFNSMWNEHGDTSIAFHPFDGSFYSRDQDYKKFGFSHFYTRSGPEYMTNLTHLGNNPHISDQASYQNVLDSLKKDKQTKQRFIQLATIQNHMPYPEGYYGPYVSASSSKYKWSADEQSSIVTYSTGMYYTDSATQHFLQELDSLSRPVTVVWYGDHLPGIYEAEMADQSNLLNLHLSDYFIWSNSASIAAGSRALQGGGITSPNYFMAQEAEHTNSRVTPYIAFLTQAHEQLPAMEPQLTTVAGLDSSKASGQATYLDSEGKILTHLNAGQRQIVHDYKLITYDLTNGRGYLRRHGFLNKVPQ